MTQNTNTIGFISLAVAIVVAAGIAVYGVTLAVDAYRAQLALATNELRAQTITDCANASKFTYTESSDNWERTTQEPSQQFFQTCLQLQGINQAATE